MFSLTIPRLGDRVPARGNAFSRAIGKLLLRSMRFSIKGEVPNVEKFVAIGAPHTSNWDFVVGMAALLALGVRVNWFGKDSIFKWPVKYVWYWLGGQPVDRFQKSGVVEQVVEKIKGQSKFILGLSPEGTRKVIQKWRTGFYHIAVGAGAPILPVFFDFKNRCLRLSQLFYPTGELNRDMRALLAIFRTVQGKYPKALPDDSAYPVDPA